MRWRVLLALLFVGSAGYGLYWFVGFKEAAIKNYFATHKPPPAPVEVAAAKRGDVPQSLAAIGTITADQQVNVTTQIAGQVKYIYFVSGQRVKKGDKLVQLDDSPERADLANFEAQSRLADANLNRSLELAKNEFAAKQTVDQTRSLLEQARAQIQRTQAIIDQKLILAPFDGVLGIRQINLGQYIGAGANIVSLTNLEVLHVDFKLPEQTASKLSIGQDVNVIVDAAQGIKFKAKINAIEPRVSETSRTLSVQATLTNSGEVLRPGMFAEVAVVLPPKENAVTVPVTALDVTLYGSSVLILEPEGNAADNIFKLRRQPVMPGIYFGNEVEIAKGLEGGEIVVASGQTKLQTGALVTPVDTTALIPPAITPLQ
ncbi:MAG TPA: efflux RND transporter periplasmic adaptor subunit [Hyphomicrobiales bacterium]|nr:efflux RND transporter periplasmic adaptor subunit [Hyphomicrobiales bacterium]